MDTSSRAGNLPATGVVVLGGGVMGRQIAALLAGAGVEVDLLDLGTDEDPAGRAREAVEALARMRPPPLFLPEDTARIHPGALADAAAPLASASWIIEAVVEDPAVKKEVLDQVEAHAAGDAIISTNTSGLSIARLCQGRSSAFRRRFLGIHFFNPPRAMRLVEIIPGTDTDAEVITRARAWVTEGLGKDVVPCRDTPNFIANRLGVFALMDALHRMQAYGLRVDAVDAVTGPLLGRPRSATLRLCDLIGLDTLLHVARTAFDHLPHDPWRQTFAPPSFVTAMVEEGHLGVKSGAGFYRKEGGRILRRCISSGAYVEDEALRLDLPQRRPLQERLRALWQEDDDAVRFAREHLVACIAYAAACAGEVAEHLEDVDRALVWGFNWEAGPLEMLDLIGAGQIAESLAGGGHPVPELVAVAGRTGRTIYRDHGGQAQVLDRHRGGYVKRTSAGPLDDDAFLAAAPVLEANDGARLLDAGDGIAVLQFHGGKLNVLAAPALQLAREAAGHRDLTALVVCGAGGNFSAGADLRYILSIIDTQQWHRLEAYLQAFQQATASMRYAAMPVVAAPRGLALGGGCEFSMSAGARVAAIELRLGLVESKVGLIPGAGGCREIVRRVGAGIDALYQVVRAGRMSDNARQAQSWGLLDPADVIWMDGHRVVLRAIQVAQRLSATWTAVSPREYSTAGSQGLARLLEGLQREHREGETTAHDVVVGSALARVLCGGGEPLVSEARLEELEREAFVALCRTAATRARIAHMLETGKPLQN